MKHPKQIPRQRLVLATSTLLLLSAVAIECADRQSAARRLDNNSDDKKGFQSPCGTAEQVSQRIGRCMDQIFELIEGRFKEPKNDVDIQGHCERFSSAEKCIRTVTKDCLTGLHKATTSAIASAMRRFRLQECKSPESRVRYIEPLMCASKRGKEMTAVYKNYTAVAQAIRDMPKASAEEKLQRGCCLLNNLDKETERQFNIACPKSTQLILGIYRAIVEDARNTLCRAPKCQGALDPFVSAKYKPPQNFMEPIMQILFGLSTD